MFTREVKLVSKFLVKTVLLSALGRAFPRVTGWIARSIVGDLSEAIQREQRMDEAVREMHNTKPWSEP